MLENKIKLALIGKNISHSQSPQMYRDILKDYDVEYDLLDISSESKLPSIKALLQDYRGISITSPYKKSFLRDIDDIMFNCHHLHAINALTVLGNKIVAINSDYLALRDIFVSYKKSIENFTNKRFVILGNGVMANIVEEVLYWFQHAHMKQEIDIVKIHRSVCGDCKNIDIDKSVYSIVQQCRVRSKENFIINCCSRSFVFSGKVSRNSIFYDLNYNLDHKSHISNQCMYIDGIALLKQQAEYSAKFFCHKL